MDVRLRAMTTGRRMAYAAALALVLCAPRNAAACFDTHVTEVGPVRIVVSWHSESGGDLRCGKDGTPCATWAARLARLLPRGARLRINSGWEVTKRESKEVEIELCLPGKACRMTQSEHAEIADSFDDIAARLGTPPARRARIRRSWSPYFTLQAGAFSNPETAEALATRIDGETGGLGASVTQGHPGPTEASWVEEATLAGGRRIYRGMTGTFPGHA